VPPLFRRDDVTLAGALSVIFAANATPVLVLPGVLGFPAGGIFLLDWLPRFAAILGAGAVVSIPIVIAARARFGAVAPVLFVLSLAALAAANAYLWVLCVQSV
jgi:hypothetical protein